MREVLVNFSNIINEDVVAFFSNYDIFVSNMYPKLLSFHQGKTKDLDSDIIKNLQSLITQRNVVEDAIRTNKDKLSVFAQYWGIFDDFEEVSTKIDSIKNIAKWARSSFVNNYNTKTTFDYVTKQNQTIENVSKSLGYNDPENDWVDITLSNRVKEADYDGKGGFLLKTELSDDSLLNVTSVIDILDGKNVLGKDYNKKITIEQSGEDLDILDTSSTFKQSVKRKLELRRGQIPETPFVGLSNVTGSSNFLRYPVIFREIAKISRLDDTIHSIELTNLRVEKDAAYIDLKVSSKLNQVLDYETIKI